MAKKSFIENTIDGILGCFEEAFISENFSKRNGFLQSLDPRAKLIFILIVIFAMSLTNYLKLLIFVYVLKLLFSYLSKINVLFFISGSGSLFPSFQASYSYL
jgi:cobalt/nickel transport system permease protein